MNRNKNHEAAVQAAQKKAAPHRAAPKKIDGDSRPLLERLRRRCICYQEDGGLVCIPLWRIRRIDIYDDDGGQVALIYTSDGVHRVRL